MIEQERVESPIVPQEHLGSLLTADRLLAVANRQVRVRDNSRFVSVDVSGDTQNVTTRLQCLLAEIQQESSTIIVIANDAVGEVIGIQKSERGVSVIRHSRAVNASPEKVDFSRNATIGTAFSPEGEISLCITDEEEGKEMFTKAGYLREGQKFSVMKARFEKRHIEEHIPSHSSVRERYVFPDYDKHKPEEVFEVIDQYKRAIEETKEGDKIKYEDLTPHKDRSLLERLRPHRKHHFDDYIHYRETREVPEEHTSFDRIVVAEVKPILVKGARGNGTLTVDSDDRPGYDFSDWLVDQGE